VTGASGCLGSNLTKRLLDNGAQVVIFKRHGDSLGTLAGLRERLEIRFGDVRDFGSCLRATAGIRSVYHVAGIATPLNRLSQSMWEVNVAGTYNVVRASVLNGVERVVHVSSTAAIGYPPDGTNATEAFDFRDSVASNSYALTKWHAERIALGFNGSGTEVVAVNPSAVIAPGGNRRYGWAALIEIARRRRLWVYPVGGSGFCGRQDVVEGMVAAMKLGRPGERYILNSANISYAELAYLVCDVCRVKPPRIKLHPAATALVSRVNDIWSLACRDAAKLPLLVSETADLLSRRLYYDSSKARQELKVPLFSLRDAVTEVHDWCKSITVADVKTHLAESRV
jgi:dihydroflavonol-4-reductase